MNAPLVFLGENMPEIITSRDNSLIKYAQKLAKSKSFRHEEKLFFAEGLRLCEEIAKTLKPKKLFYTEKVAQKCEHLLELCSGAYEIKDHVAQKLSATQNTQGVFALFEMNNKSLNSVQNEAKYVIMENVQDPANVGAIIRSAAAFGFSGAVLCGACADAFADKALRASMGAAARIDVIIEESTELAVKCMQNKNIHVYAAALSGSVSLNEVQKQNAKGIAVLLGNEGNGLTQNAIDIADTAVRIPMAQTAESLNVSVSAGVFMYALGNV